VCVCVCVCVSGHTGDKNNILFLLGIEHQIVCIICI